jgi:diguanylate cyclase (GGDEF)-like protein
MKSYVKFRIMTTSPMSPKEAPVDNQDSILGQLVKARQELSTLFEISNAMHKTLELDEILYIILTGVTSHSGLGFNRAILLLLDSQAKSLEGRMGIGPDNGEEAGRIWGLIDEQKMGLDDLVNAYGYSREALSRSKFFNQVKNFHVSALETEGGILAKVLNDGMPFHIKKDNIASFANDPLFTIFASEEFVVIPLKAKDKSIGLIVADNLFTRRTITKDDIRILMMFANQAGMALENSQLYEKALVRAHKDALTDLWNHGYFQRVFDEELRHSKEQASYLSLIILDIDNFKNYNDTWGHQKGDAMLTQISSILTESSRKIDWVCRYGGEEFTVILPKATRKDAMLIAERIRANIEQFKFASTSDSPPQKITVSLGISTFPDDGTTKSELIKAADEALYDAKRQGKNRSAFFQSKS